MKAIFSSPHLFLVNHYKNIVESNDIVCVIRNTFLSGAVGELPPTEVWPSLWVVDADDYERASKIITLAMVEFNADGPTWVCEGCGEVLILQFSECWKCGGLRHNLD
ncbi:MAG: DUF2007 domain-containing protein [Gammaproteobacteria bacterium]|nr:DUF2007 domain-containing protein [Gammaproteobacteria bacterium]